MPVDDELLKDKIQELNVQISNLNKQKKELEGIYQSLQRIQKTEERIHEVDENGEPVTRIEMRDPKDGALGETISVARRQQIYDSMIAKADTLLNA